MNTRIGQWLRAGIVFSLLLVAVAPAAVAAAPGDQAGPLVQVAHNAKLGDILVDARGITLYELTSEGGGTFHCLDGCLKFWPPLFVPAGVSAPTGGAGVTGTLGVISRPDGGNQVTYNGFPLYNFAFDKAPGDTNGNGIHAFEGTWLAAPVTTTPIGTPAVVSQGTIGKTASFTVNFTSSHAGQGEVYFGSGPGCSGLVEVATQDLHAGTTVHAVQVTGNDLPGTVGNNGIQPGTTYWFEVVTVTQSGVQIDDNGGKCYSVMVPSS